jgi:CubicO group peptidase (beta-lactamase class C family)
MYERTNFGCAGPFLIMIMVLCAGAAAAAPREEGRLPDATPDAVGLSAAVVEEHAKLCRSTGADSFLVVCRDRVVSEWYSPQYDGSVYAMSSTKSITSLLVGMLVDEGKIGSVDDAVRRYVPAFRGGEKDTVTIRHLLTHTSGLVAGGSDSVGFAWPDKNQHVIELPLAYAPGARFRYSNEAVQLLSPVMDAAAGEPVQDYAKRRLFDELGMKHTRFHLDGAGHAWTYADLETTPRDLARIGQLMLRRGSWRGRRIVSEGWLERSLAPSQPFDAGCGLLWWLFPASRGYAAHGHLDTHVFIIPEKQQIVVRTQSKPGPPPEGEYRKRAMPLFEAM